MTTKYYKVTKEFLGTTAVEQRGRIFHKRCDKSEPEIYYIDEYDSVLSAEDMIDIIISKEYLE